MPIFISYSHENKEFVDQFGAQLALHGARVWIDRWELSVGDSLIDKVQSAIQGSDALIIVLSKASVESEWCKKELSSGLIRELEEKRVVVLPVLIEECKIPLFLRDKMYADFRKNYDIGFETTLDAIAKITSESSGRLINKTTSSHVDWAIDWGLLDELLALRIILVEIVRNYPYSVLTEITFHADVIGTERFMEFKRSGATSDGQYELISMLLKRIEDGNNINLIIESESPQAYRMKMNNSEAGASYRILITTRRLGEDNGKNILVDVGGQIKNIIQSLENIRRKS